MRSVRKIYLIAIFLLLAYCILFFTNSVNELLSYRKSYWNKCLNIINFKEFDKREKRQEFIFTLSKFLTLEPLSLNKTCTKPPPRKSLKCSDYPDVS